MSKINAIQKTKIHIVSFCWNSLEHGTLILRGYHPLTLTLHSASTERALPQKGRLLVPASSFTTLYKYWHFTVTWVLDGKWQAGIQRELMTTRWLHFLNPTAIHPFPGSLSGLEKKILDSGLCKHLHLLSEAIDR